MSLRCLWWLQSSCQCTFEGKSQHLRHQRWTQQSHGRMCCCWSQEVCGSSFWTQWRNSRRQSQLVECSQDCAFQESWIIWWLRKVPLAWWCDGRTNRIFQKFVLGWSRIAWPLVHFEDALWWTHTASSKPREDQGRIEGTQSAHLEGTARDPTKQCRQWLQLFFLRLKQQRQGRQLEPNRV